jgi:hypothetical protein
LDFGQKESVLVLDVCVKPDEPWIDVSQPSSWRFEIKEKGCSSKKRLEVRSSAPIGWQEFLQRGGDLPLSASPFQ